MPKFSVIIPTYNRDKFLIEAIDSALNQSFRDFEIIVVDDGSTDDTKVALQPYQRQIKYIYQENSGVSAARNAGIKMASGEWISFLDSDDEWTSGYLAAQNAHAQRYPATVAHLVNAVTIPGDDVAN